MLCAAPPLGASSNSVEAQREKATIKTPPDGTQTNDEPVYHEVLYINPLPKPAGGGRWNTFTKKEGPESNGRIIMHLPETKKPTKVQKIYLFLIIPGRTKSVRQSY